MADRPKVSWRDRYPEEVTCVRCLEVKPKDDLDRLLWCPACRERAARRASLWGWLGGTVIAAVLALWIFVFIEPSRELILGGWIATIVAALWIGSKVVREIAYGVERYRNRRAVEAMPPAVGPGTDAGADGGADAGADGGADGGDGLPPHGDRAPPPG